MKRHEVAHIKLKEPMVSFLRRNYRVLLAMAVLFIADLGFSDGQMRAAPLLEYDPLRVPPDFVATTLELKVLDAPCRRTIPLLIYLGSDMTPAPLVLFSHGLGGSRQNNAFLGRHWAARNYVAVFLQHPGSDESVWQGKPEVR